MKTSQNARRDFLKKSLLFASLPLFSGISLMPLSAQAFVPTTRKRGSTLRNVMDYGALGNGVHDDTSAIQKAINSLPSDGGTVFIPAGTYKINAVTGILLRSYMHLQLDPGATLQAITTVSDKYNIVMADNIHDVEISGGQILGERLTHTGTIGEGGHCVRIHGSQRVTVRDVRLANGWGDGMSVGPKPVWQSTYIYSKDVDMNNVICFNNRRNGLSIGNVVGMRVFNSQFLNTNGTKPQCGIDVEPSPDIDGSGHCDQVWIEACVMSGNAKYGVNVWKNTSNLTITKCNLEKNLVCGIVTTGLNGFTFTNNSVNNNMSTGMFLQTNTVNAAVSGNTFFANYLKQGPVNRAPFCMSGVTTKVRKDMIVGTGTSNIQIGSNCYK